MPSQSDLPYFIRLEGELDAFSRKEKLQVPVSRAIAEGHRCLMLDFARVRLVDAAAIGLLVDIHLFLEASGGRLQLLNVDQRLRRLLSITALAEILHLPLE